MVQLSRASRLSLGLECASAFAPARLKAKRAGGGSVPKLTHYQRARLSLDDAALTRQVLNHNVHLQQI